MSSLRSTEIAMDYMIKHIDDLLFVINTSDSVIDVIPPDLCANLTRALLQAKDRCRKRRDLVKYHVRSK